MAVPTTYRGVEYRSRLHARWAAFLRLSCYEPESLGDGVFLITDGAGRRWRVAVRPFEDERRCLRILGQLDGELGDGDDERWPPGDGFIIVGVNPGITAGARQPYGGLVKPPWGDQSSHWEPRWREAGVEVKYGA